LSGNRRHRYVLELTGKPPDRAAVDVTVRQPAAADRERLAVLMLDAYRDTIDDEGETLDDARREVGGYLDGRALLDCSVVCEQGTALPGACLVSYLPNERVPLIAYIMVASTSKQGGLGRALVSEALARLHDAGYARVLAVITEGNVPSERLFTGLGFTRM
jgi:GNAT superfamily N-acetyltransferase